jgi:hypothetical protein
LRRFSPAAEAVETAAPTTPPAVVRGLDEFRPIRLKTFYDVGDLPLHLLRTGSGTG